MELLESYRVRKALPYIRLDAYEIYQSDLHQQINKKPTNLLVGFCVLLL